MSRKTRQTRKASRRQQGMGVTVPGTRSNNARVPMQVASRNQRPVVNRIFKEKGSDFLGLVTTKADISTVANRILKSIDVRPDAFPGTRLSQLAPLYERYRFRKFNVRYVPAVPTSIGCQLQVYQDLDPNDDPSVITDPDALIRQATAQSGAQQFNFFAPHTIPLAQRKDDQMYYTGQSGSGDKRFSTQARIHIIQNTQQIAFDGSVVSTNLTGGSLFADWECDFQTPQINPEAAAKSLLDDPPYEVTYSNFASIQAAAGTTNGTAREFTMNLNVDQEVSVVGDIGIGTSKVELDIGGNTVVLWDNKWTDPNTIVGGPLFIPAGTHQTFITGGTLSAPALSTNQFDFIGVRVGGTPTLNLVPGLRQGEEPMEEQPPVNKHRLWHP